MNSVFSALRLCVILFIPTFSFAQTNADTLQIKQVEIISSRFDNFSSAHVQKIDSLTFVEYRTADLSTLLSEQSGIFIKSYGLGSSATTSARGSGASHTTILWNGFSINNAMLGQSDFSLVPVNLFSGINIRYGNSCALAGSGAIGSTIELNNKPVFGNGLKTSALFAAGSFENYREQFQTEISSAKTYSSVSFFNHSAKNNFPFVNTAQIGKPEQEQTNNSLQQYGFMAGQAFKFSGNKILSFNAWYQNSSRQIPPTMTTAESVSFQDDKIFRGAANFQVVKTKSVFNARAGYFDESIRYVDGLIKLNSYGSAKTFLAEAETHISLSSNQKLITGITNSYVKAFADEYKQSRFRNTLAAFASYSIRNKKESLSASVAIRNELIDEVVSPFTYQLSSQWKISKSFSFVSSFSKVYRTPSLNDLYWIPGGNKNLQPEKGYSAEAGFDFGFRISDFGFKFNTTFYSQQITNWIIWLPGNGGYWTPQNIYKVWSRGNETSASVKFKVRKLYFDVGISAYYTLSTNETETLGDNLKSKQLIYVPELTCSAFVRVTYRQTVLSFTHHYTGERFTTTDNKDFLEPYANDKIFIAQTFKCKKHGATISFAVNNLFDATYQCIQYRPMPSRNYEITFQYQFTKLKSN